ncbi:hypothetical protein HWV62_7994 [Athelia sp. TMB]|nr:hypothetical protein HWV62_16654 [Athelia sp. TMB]KAF7975999.1 hypothetical protein HWV62_7994 [Athelia sp. TMB]
MDPLNNIRIAYHELARKVARALHTQLGDEHRLRSHQREVLQFVEDATTLKHREAFEAVEFGTLLASADIMLDELDQACHRSTDTPDGPHVVVVERVRTGRRGRPRVHIDPNFLTEALTHRGPTGIAPVISCSSRTVRRRALDLGLVQPAQPVFKNVILASGETTRAYNVPTPAPPPTIPDATLDSMVLDALTIFPGFGRSMLAGYLDSRGISVTRERLRAAYLRVNGTPVAWGNRTIDRRAYSVAGANSLWHHDGQHGLIKYKIVQHCFIDGHSRLITGIKASNNNRASTVMELFRCCMDEHGVPSRVRGDHGTENLEVAAWMEQYRGSNRGSYIWGRSVHNTRIERLWYDITHGYGQHWKNFFYDLEIHHGLNPQVPEHIWLLHHLFLDAVNSDAQAWMQAWNRHKLQIKGERARSPKDMFFFSTVQDGPRGLQPHDDIEIDPNSYGVDWEVADDPTFMNHLIDQNPQEWAEGNPFARGPEHHAHVPCEPPNCPFTVQQVNWIDETLAGLVDIGTQDMVVRRLVWVRAFELCVDLWNDNVVE